MLSDTLSWLPEAYIPGLILCIAVLFCTVLWRMYYRNHRKVRSARAAIFSDCDKAMNISETHYDRAGYAAVSAEFNGMPLALKLEVDNFSARKIPVMWLHMTVTRKPAGSGSLDILIRPQNTEVYSPSWLWPKTVMPLRGWPQHARYMTRDHAPDLAAIDEDVKTLFADEKCKELLITPDAIRVTYLIRQADRGHYMLLRSIEFDHSPIDSDQVAALARQLQCLLTHLDGERYEAA